MAKLFGSQIDLQKIPLLNVVIHSSPTEPSTPVNGQLWFDTTQGVMKVREAGVWLLVANAASGSTPTGPAGGDLAGSYPDPTIGLLKVVTGYLADGAVTALKIGNGTITDVQVAAANKDGTAGTASLRTLGTGAQQAAPGNDTRFSDARTPSGPASGDLSGSYPGPTIGVDKVTASHIAPLTITDAEVAVANKDGAIGTASLRTLGTGALQALAGNTRLDQIAAPTTSVGLNNQKIVGLGTPTADTDAATKLYVDNAALGLDAKASVKAATTTNIALSGAQTVDGVSLVTNDRCLVKDQSTASANGIYDVKAGAWTRSTDMDTWAEVPSAFVFVEQGTTQADSGWVATADQGGTLGSTNITWTQFSGAGQITAGAGLTKTGNTLDVGGTTNRITVATDAVDIAATYVGQASITTVGTITAGTWTGTDIAVADGGTGASTAAAARTNLGAVGKYAGTLAALSAGVELNIVHNLNSTDVIAAFKVVASNVDLELAWRTVDANTVGVTADIAYSASAVRAVVIG